MPAAKEPFKVPKKFGDWIVTGMVDEKSGFGDIYQVKWVHNERKRAVVKTIKYDHKPEHYPKLLQMFHQEVIILQNLEHDNICRFYEADLNSSLPWFAMQFYRGNNILQELEDFGPAPEDIWFQRAKEILSALEYAHERRVMHGDLNPKNILIDGRGAKLIDFGIARLVDPDSNHRTRLSFAPGWQAPEHSRGIPRVETDIFVLASLLVLFGTGKYPFTPESTGDFQDSIDNDEPKYFNLSTNQKLLLKPMHEKDPNRRITATQALKLLEKLQPSNGARPIVEPVAKPAIKPAIKPVAKAKPVAKKPAQKNSLVEQFEARAVARSAARQVPPGIELLPNGARVAGWRQPAKSSSLSDMPPGFWIAIAAIFTAGLALIPYVIIKLFLRGTKEFEPKIRVRLGVSVFLYFVSFGMLAPFITWWWARRIGYLHLKVILVVQSLLATLVFMGTVAEAGESPSGFLWFIRLLGIGASYWSYSVIKEKLLGKPRLDKKSRKEKRQKERSSEITGGHQTWDEVRETFKTALAKHHGKRFIIEILSAEYKDIYFQGYSEPDGARTIEASADLAIRPHLTEDQKVKMELIGWDRPSEGLPNFIMFLEADESDDDDLAEIFTKSLRDGYGLSIPKFRVIAKDR